MQRPTMETVAERAGVSRALVSLVMNEAPNVSDGKRKAVLQAARELGYRPNLHARNLAQQRTHTVGILINDIQNPFFAEVVAGIEEASANHDFGVMILNGSRDRDRERRALETFLEFQVEAMILIGTRLGDEELNRAGQLVPTVVVAAGGAQPSTDTVSTNEQASTRLAVDHLVGLGHTAIVHIDGGANISTEPRRVGFARAMHAHGLEPHIEPGGDNSREGATAMNNLLAANQPLTAILAFNDVAAAGAIDALSSAGLSVPSDVSVVSIDNTFIASLGLLSLTAVNQPRRKMGQLAFTTALERLHQRDTAQHEPGLDSKAERPNHLTLAPRLVVRASSGPPPAGHRLAHHPPTTGRAEARQPPKPTTDQEE